MPPILDMALALEMKGAVQITAAGTSSFSNSMASCTLHDEQDPQSPVEVMTMSHSSAISSRRSLGHGLEALPLLRATTSLNSYLSESTSWTSSKSSSALGLPLASRPTVFPSSVSGRGALTALDGYRRYRRI